MDFMRLEPHETVVGMLRRAYQVHQQRSGLKFEAIAADMFGLYFRMGMDRVWPLEIQQPGPGSPAGRVMKTNAERFKRWLNEEGRGRNQLPPNMLQVVLAALPADLRLMVLAEILRPVGVEVSLAPPSDGGDDYSVVLSAVAKENGEGVAAFARLSQGHSLPALRAAEKELVEGMSSSDVALQYVRRRLNSLPIEPRAPKCRASSKDAG